MTRAKFLNLSVAGMISASFFLVVLVIIFSNPVTNDGAVTALFFCLLIAGVLLFRSALEDGVYAPTIFVLLYFTWFYIVPGIFQTASNRYFWPQAHYDSDTALTAAIAILLFLVFFALGQHATPTSLRKKYLSKIAQSEKMRRRGLILSLATMTLLGCCAIIAAFGIENFIGSRAAVSNALSSNLEKSIVGLIVWFPRMLLTVCILMLLYLRRREHQSKAFSTILIVVSIAVLFIVAFPGALPRFQFFAITITFILVLFPFRRPHSRIIAVLIMSFGVFTVFPVFQAVNRGKTFDTNIEIPKASEYMLYGDFDGFQTTMNVVVHTEQNGHTMGRQILSAALFFVPRSFWKDKGEATGVMVSEDLGWHFTNLSTPIVGELYIDGGLLGVIIGGFLIGHLFRRLDHMYTAAVDYGGITLPRIGIAVLSSIIIILFRGPLLGVIGFCLAPIAVVYLVHIWPYLLRFIVPRRSRQKAPVAAE